MTSIFGGGSNINVNAAGTILPETFPVAAGQTLFTITKFTYTPGSNSLYVFLNGQLQTVGVHLIEKNTTQFEFVDQLVSTDSVTALGFPLANVIQPSGNFAQQTSPTGSLVVPKGTTAERDASPLASYLRWNTTLGRLEVYNGSQWASAGVGAVLPVLRRDGVTITNVPVV